MMIIRGAQAPAVAPARMTTAPWSIRWGNAPRWCSRLTWQLIVFPRYARSALALQVGQPRAQRLRGYLATVAQAHGENPAA